MFFLNHQFFQCLERKTSKKRKIRKKRRRRRKRRIRRIARHPHHPHHHQMTNLNMATMELQVNIHQVLQANTHQVHHQKIQELLLLQDLAVMLTLQLTYHNLDQIHSTHLDIVKMESLNIKF